MTEPRKESAGALAGDVRVAERPEVVQGISYTLDEGLYTKNDSIDENADSAQEPIDNTRLFSCSTLKLVLPSIVPAMSIGYGIGFVGPYATLYSYATNCQLYGAKAPCETLSAANCRWFDASTYVSNTTYGEVCGWADTTTCFLMYSDEASCTANSACKWSSSAGTCGNQVGYTSILSGLFAGSMIMGTTLGAFAGGYLTKRLDYRKSYFVFGLIAVAGCVLTHVATGTFQYWLLFAARIVLGFALGWQCVAAPSYTATFSPKSLQKTLGTLFQVFGAFGSFVAAVFAICVGNTIEYNADHNAQVMARMQGLVSFSTLLSAALLLCPLITHDSGSARNAAEDAASEPSGARAPGKTHSVRSMLGRLAVGVALACTMQLTGISANMTFAPTIMGNLGLDGLVGNVILMAWYSVAAFGVIPLSKRFTMRTLFLSAGLIGSLSCIFLSGIPVYPGVTNMTRVKEIVAIVGIALFMACFSMGIGPCFFVLTVDVFPESFRPIGSAFTTGFMFALNLIINICYPIATEGISGGPSGNQDKGQAIAFIFFGCIGLLAVVFEFFFLHPWVEREEELPTPERCTHAPDAACPGTR